MRSIVRRAAGWGDGLSFRAAPELRDHPTPSRISLRFMRADPPPPREGKHRAISDSIFKEPTPDTTSRSRDALHPRFARKFPPSPIRGRGDAGRPMRPIAACAKVESKKHTRWSGHTGITRHSPRNGLRSITRSPRRPAFLPPSPLGSLLLKSLTPASGCQDHTPSPSASKRSRLQRPQRPPHPAPRP